MTERWPDVSSSEVSAGSSSDAPAAPVTRDRRRRLLWIGHLTAAVSVFALLRAVSSVWFTFTFDGAVQPTWTSPQTSVDVHKVFYASDVAGMFGGVGPLPTPLVLTLLVLAAAAVAAWLQLWVLSAGATVVLVPIAWMQLDQLMVSVTSGPSGDLVSMASGPSTTVFALFAAAGFSLVVTVQTIAVRRAHLAAERAQAAASGATPPPTLRELTSNLVAARLNRFANPHPSTVKSPTS